MKFDVYRTERLPLAVMTPAALAGISGEGHHQNESMLPDRFKTLVGPKSRHARLSVMITQPYRIYIERNDRQKNMARFYALAIESTLFGEICLRRRWGRIGTYGQELAHYFESEKEAVSLFLDLARRKRNRGYSPAKVVSAVRS